MANRFGINKEAYDAQYEAWEKTLPENPEKAQEQVIDEAEEAIEAEGMKVVADLTKEEEKLRAMAEEAPSILPLPPRLNNKSSL